MPCYSPKCSFLFLIFFCLSNSIAIWNILFSATLHVLLLGQKKDIFTSSTFADDLLPKEFNYFINVQIPMAVIGLHKSVHFSLLIFAFGSRY